MTNAYHYIKQNLRNNLRTKLIGWRQQKRFVKIDKPSDIGRARALGYKDKKGFVVIRVRLKRGGRKKSRINKNRRSKRQTVRKTLKMNYQWVAEIRAANKFKNLEVLNSYKIAKDGIYYFFEVIMVDPEQAEIKSLMPWLVNKNRNRALRGLTSAGKKARGLR